MSLAGCGVIVTGATGGIGRAVVSELLRREAQVIAVGRNEQQLARLVEEHGDRVAAVRIDLGTAGAAAEVVDRAKRSTDRLFGVINNAGLARFDSLVDASSADLIAMMTLHVLAPAELIRAALPYLEANGGSVVNVSSVGGAVAMPGRSFYGASKAALNSLTRSLAIELAPRVRVNAILPGPVNTPMWTDLGLDAAGTEQLRTALSSATPMARFGEPEDIARWVAILLDPVVSGWVTGALIPVDGGRTA